MRATMREREGAGMQHILQVWLSNACQRIASLSSEMQRRAMGALHWTQSAAMVVASVRFHASSPIAGPALGAPHSPTTTRFSWSFDMEPVRYALPTGRPHAEQQDSLEFIAWRNRQSAHKRRANLINSMLASLRQQSLMKAVAGLDVADG